MASGTTLLVNVFLNAGVNGSHFNFLYLDNTRLPLCIRFSTALVATEIPVEQPAGKVVLKSNP